MPVYGGEPEASDPVPLQEEESLASLAALAGLPLTNRNVTAYIQSFSVGNTADIQGAIQ